MSIASVITRLQNAKTAIASAITAKGGTVAADDGYEDFADAIAGISTTPEVFSEFACGIFIPTSDIAGVYTKIPIDFTKKPAFTSIRILDDYSVDASNNIFILSQKGLYPDTTNETMRFYKNNTAYGVTSNVTGGSTNTMFIFNAQGTYFKAGHKYAWMCGNWKEYDNEVL